MADTSQDPTLLEVLKAAHADNMVDMHTNSWGRVLNYDRSSKRATIQLVPRRPKYDEDDNRTTEQIAPLNNVPILFQGSKSVSINWTLNPGDVVMVVFMEYSTIAWLTTGNEAADSNDDKRFALNFAMAIPVDLSPIAIDNTNPASVVINGDRIDLGDNELNPLQDGVLTGEAIDPFTGSPHYALGNASTKVLAKK